MYTVCEHVNGFIMVLQYNVTLAMGFECSLTLTGIYQVCHQQQPVYVCVAHLNKQLNLNDVNCKLV